MTHSVGADIYTVVLGTAIGAIFGAAVIGLAVTIGILLAVLVLNEAAAAGRKSRRY